MATSVPTLTSDQLMVITSYINTYRAKNQAPPMSYDSKIAGFSQQWSNYLLTNNLFQHSGTPLYGENLAYFEGYGTDTVKLIKMAIDAWYNEISLYDFNNPGFSEATGHFTCLVWQASTSFGIAISINPSTSAAIITMNTAPQGNVIGEFAQNVLPVSSPVPTPVPLPVPSPSPVPLPVPLPVPSPVPLPVPSPSPVPLPSPSPSPFPLPVPLPVPSEGEHVRQIITLLNNFIYSVHSRQPENYLVYQILTVINYLSTLKTIPTLNNIINVLQMTIRAIKAKRPAVSIIMTIQNIIISLYPYAK